MKLRLAIGADHGGFALKNELVTRLRKEYEVLDLGAETLDPADDYPDFVRAFVMTLTQPTREWSMMI